jgi:hemerythrin-like domain-containing protein
LLEPAAKARLIAEESLEFFREAIFEHHLEEERELFPAVIASAQPGAELERVKAMAKRLTDEHRAIEALWKQLEKGLKPVAKGQSTRLDVSELHRLVTEYKAHAAYEETEFLPLSEEILGRNSNHMAALGLSLHMRHAKPVNAYI